MQVVTRTEKHSYKFIFLDKIIPIVTNIIPNVPSLLNQMLSADKIKAVVLRENFLIS